MVLLLCGGVGLVPAVVHALLRAVPARAGVLFVGDVMSLLGAMTITGTMLGVTAAGFVARLQVAAAEAEVSRTRSRCRSSS